MDTLTRQGVGAQLYDILKKRITSLELKPGERIGIQALSKEFSVSAIPLREALKRLTERGLVQYEPDIGYRVVCISREGVKEIFALRQVLELFALERAINAIPLSSLRRLREESTRLFASGLSDGRVRAAFRTTDTELHQELIIKYCPNTYLHDVYERLNDLISIARQHERINEAIDEHLGIIDSLMKRNLAQARERLRAHLTNSAEACCLVAERRALVEQ